MIPAGNSPRVRRLRDEIAPGAVIQKIPVRPAPDAGVDECVHNVAAVVEHSGGAAVLGWTFWDAIPGALLEAEFHVVWRGGSGALVDVTPKAAPGITHIFFVVDPSLSYEGRQIDSRRAAIADDALIDAFIAAAEARFEVLNRGDRATQHGSIRLTGADAAVIDEHDRLLSELLQRYG